jgi:hypothetical protein
MVDGTTISARRMLAVQHVERGNAIVVRQRRLIDKLRAMKGATSGAEELVDAFERSLAIFEDDLDRLETGRPVRRWHPGQSAYEWRVPRAHSVMRALR